MTCRSIGLLSAALALILSPTGLLAGEITYDLNAPLIAGSTATGTITTDGDIGTIGVTDIVDWNITLTDGAGTFDLTGPLSGNNSGILSQGSDLTATSSNLSFNFSADDGGRLIFENPSIGSGGPALCYASTDDCTPAIAVGINITTQNGEGDVNNTIESGTEVIASAGSSTPEPGSFGLLGIGMVGVLRMMRKRNAPRHA
jgi:hypothetical protein